MSSYNFYSPVYAGAIGDNPSGILNWNTESLSPLQLAINKIKEKMGDSEELVEFIEDLSDYTTVRQRKIVGLENKLRVANREDLIEDALYLKNKFERRLARTQMILSEQMVYVQVLAFICTAFNNKVLPLIKEGRDNSIVDSKIHDDIIIEVYESITYYDQTITTETIRGMLYYLTGKCHLVWN